jgi:hypothetical protein
VVDYGVIKIGVTPASVAERHGLPPLPFLLLGTTFGAGITYLCRDGEPLEKAAAIGIGSLLASPYALAYDLTIIMPLLAARALQGKILPAWGMVSSFHPLPLAIAAFELVRKLLWKLEAPWSMRRIRTPMSPETQ